MMNFRALATLAALMAACAVFAKPPVRNMTVELRVVSQADAERTPLATSGGATLYSARPRDAGDAALDIQKVFVMNGERAQMKLSKAIPLQWVKTALTQPPAAATTAGTVGGTASSANAGLQGVENALTWMQVARELAVQVRWPGGNQNAVLEIQLESADVDTSGGQQLPPQTQSRLSSTVSVPLGEWTTVAVTGTRAMPERAGVYSTRAQESDAAKWVQVRVLAP